MRREVLAVALLCSGCAAMPEGRSLTHPVSFTSDPTGAVVMVEGQECITPCTLQLAAGEHPASVFLEGERRAVTASVAPQGGRGVAGVVRDTGEVFKAYGEMGLQAAGAVHAPVEAAGVLVIASGILSIGSIAAGQMMVTIGDVLDDSSPSRKYGVHVVFAPSDN